MVNARADVRLKTRLVWLMFGAVIGIALGYVGSHSVGPPLGCGRGEARVLIKDLTIGINEYVQTASPPVAGTIRRGSEFEVKARLGGRVYVSFAALLPNDVVEESSVARDDRLSRATSSPNRVQRE